MSWCSYIQTSQAKITVFAVNFTQSNHSWENLTVLGKGANSSSLELTAQCQEQCWTTGRGLLESFKNSAPHQHFVCYWGNFRTLQASVKFPVMTFHELTAPQQDRYIMSHIWNKLLPANIQHHWRQLPWSVQNQLYAVKWQLQEKELRDPCLSYLCHFTAYSQWVRLLLLVGKSTF